MVQPRQMRLARYLFMIPAICHAVQSACVLASDGALETATLADVYRICGPVTWVVLALTAITGAGSVLIHSRRPMTSLVLLLPQQALVTVSGMTAMHCMINGQFADGVRYDRLFIAADQIYLPTILVCHLALMIHVYWGGLWSARSSAS